MRLAVLISHLATLVEKISPLMSLIRSLSDTDDHFLKKKRFVLSIPFLLGARFSEKVWVFVFLTIFKVILINVYCESDLAFL